MAKEATEHSSRQARPPAESALRRAQALGPDRAAGDGRRRQGRHDQARVQRRQSARRAGRELQAADRRPNSRMISSGASIRTRRDAGKSRSSTGRTTRTCWSTRVHKLIDKATWTRRYREIRDFEALLVPERDHDPQILPPYQQGRAARAFRPAPRRTQAATGRSARPTIPSASSGTTTSRRLRTRFAPPAPVRRRGTSSRRTPNGSAIWRCRRSSPTRWPISTSPTRRRRLTSLKSGASIMPRPTKPEAAGRRPDRRAGRRFP